MKLLIYEWVSYLQYDLDCICKEKNISTEHFKWQFTNKNEDDPFEAWFDKEVDCGQFDAIFSVNYWPMISKVAQKNGIRYISWCYDNPLNVINIEETLGNAVNTVVMFDRVQAEKYLNAGFETVYYLPLAVNTKRLSKLQPGKEDVARYGAEVSFVGNLYASELPAIKSLMDEYSKGYVEALLSAQQNLYGCYLFDDVIDQTFVEKINSHIKKNYPKSEFQLLPEALRFAMASEVTRKERLVLLTLLGKRYDTKLYSYENSEVLKGVKVCSSVDYVTEMPKVFACSQINLNPGLRCIQSGIPLRALDIMGAGGFLLSNFQPELAEYFINDEEMVMYESIEDALAKTKFYLSHEDIRKQISDYGKKRVFEAFDMRERFAQILELAGLLDPENTSTGSEGILSGKYHFYIAAPAGFSSGGPELAHQLCYELNRVGVEADMYYTAGGALEPVDTEALPKYDKYQTGHAVDYHVVNAPNSMMVINESATSYIPYFPKAKKALWWMSVDNYLIDPGKISAIDMEKYVDYHLVQSQYAFDYVKNTLHIPEKKILFLSDYIHKGFQEVFFDSSQKQDLVLYNPKKGYENIAPLIAMTPEVKWVPLINFTEDKLMKVMQLAKVYVDLGNHPGKDRMPRETALSGCCVITNKQGSAAYTEDIPIPEEYKFEDFANQYREMKQLILDICNHFEEHSIHFDAYRNWIKEEKQRFTTDTCNMVERMNQDAK